VTQGFAFFEYVDPAVTDVAIAALSGMTLGDRQLVIQRASVGAKAGQPGFPDLLYEQFPEIPRPIVPAGDVSEDDARVLLMLNMVTPDDLVDDEEYVEIVDDVQTEGSKYGAVEDGRIPRPSHGRGHHPSDQANGVGRVYIKFVDSTGAVAGMKALLARSQVGASLRLHLEAIHQGL
jgi:splicing factor U2AF subunit